MKERLAKSAGHCHSGPPPISKADDDDDDFYKKYGVK